MSTYARNRHRGAIHRRHGTRIVIALAVLGAGLLLWRQTGNQSPTAQVPVVEPDPTSRLAANASPAAAGVQAAPTALDITEARAHQLLARHFPAQYRSVQFHRVWLVLDEGGALVLSGELEGEQALRDLDEQLGRGLAGRTPGPWRTLQLQNLGGQRIDLALAQVALGEGR